MRVMRAGHPDIAWLSHNLANLYSDEGKYREADPLFERAVAMISATYGKDSLEAQKYVVDYAIDQYAQGRWAKADALYGGYFSRMRRIYAGLFQYLGEKDRLSFTSLLKGNVETYFSLCLKYHDAAPQLAGEMYDVLLWHKGLVGGSIAALRARIAASGDPEALALLDRLSEQKTRLAGLLGSPGEDHAAWQAEVRQQQQRADDLEKQLVQRSASLRQEEGLQQVSWQQVRDTLKPGEAAVELVRFRFDDGRNAPGPLQYRYVALVLRPGMRGPQFIEIGKADARLDAAVAEYSAHLGRFGAPPPATVTFYQAFWQPLEPALAGVQRIYLSPDGIYNQASLGIVPDGGGRLLMERYDLHVLPSTRDLARAPDRREGASAVLVGGPDFALSPGGYLAAVSRLQQAPGASGPLLAVQAAPGASQLSRDAFAGGKCPQPGAGILCPLPGAAEEVESVRDLLGAKQWQATLYAGDSALEEAVRAVHHPRLLHIATHGFFLPDQRAGAGSAEDPMLRSGLYLAGADNALAGNLPPEGADNGILTAYEAEQLDLGGTELVVLSACDTGLGTSQSGEGVFGLNRALQEAGAQAVLMSMWSVPDQETRELMQLFYRNWLGGMEKHEALRQAELTERDVVKQRYGHDLPYYWGAFVMVGR
jgi:CHAT domain-containing protein